MNQWNLRPREPRKCHYCGKIGHIKDNCWALHGGPNTRRPEQPYDLEEFVDANSFLNTLDPSNPDGVKAWNNVQAIRTCLQESSFNLFCSYTELLMTEGLQDVDDLTKAQVSMLDIDTSSFTINNESLKLSLQQADKDLSCFVSLKIHLSGGSLLTSNNIISSLIRMT